jgi:hypothetical protein
VEAYLVYHIDKDMNVLSTEATDHLEFGLAGEDCLNQGMASYGEKARLIMRPQAGASRSTGVNESGVGQTVGGRSPQ